MRAVEQVEQVPPPEENAGCCDEIEIMGNSASNLLFVAAPFLLALTLQQPVDSMDSVRAFRPENRYFKAELVSLHFIVETSPIPKVASSFAELLQRYGLPTDASGCADGVFVGESPFDAYDYRHVARITVKDERIVSVDYDEIHRSGRGKRGDSEYNQEMSVTGTSPALAYPSMERNLVEKQNFEQVDAVSGASYSLYRFRYAVMVALIKARLAR